jgi:small-conductance mechanosensitive channel
MGDSQGIDDRDMGAAIGFGSSTERKDGRPRMNEKLLESFRNFVNYIVGLTPKVIVGVVLLTIGMLAAKLIERALRLLLVRVRFDSLIERVGVDRALQRIGLRQQLDQFIPRLLYFLLLFLLAKITADALGLVAISEAISAFFAYLPNIIAALLLLILGGTLGQFAGQMVTDAAENSGLEFAPTLGRMVSGLVLFIVSVMALAQLKIDTEMIRLVTSFVLAAAALGFGLSFGLGARDLVRNVIAGHYVRKIVELGRELEIAGQRGTVTAITATHTILETDSESINVSNVAFLEVVSKTTPRQTR